MSDGTATTQGQIFIFIVGSIIVAIILGVVRWVRKKLCDVNDTKEDVKKIKRALLLKMELDDVIAKQVHKEFTPEIESYNKQIRELLFEKNNI